MAAIFGYDRPDRFTVAAAIRDSLLVSDAKPYGGIPNEIWIDNGKELLSYHVEQLTRELGITLQPCAPHQPQLKGIVERFFETLNTRLWSRLPGYVASNTVERNPKAKAELTLSELVEEFWSFVAKYSQEVHSETGQTPLDYWKEHCFAEPVDPRRLDILLKEPTNRRVTKEGLKYEGRVYWHIALAGLVGRSILVRAEPSYSAPDEIEVFHDGQWICTAFAIDSEMGRSVTRSQVVTAQREQREQARHIINQARDALADADREIEESNRVAEPEELPAPPTPSSGTTETKMLKKAKKRKPDLLDRLADLDK
jgi:putative transposase